MAADEMVQLFHRLYGQPDSPNKLAPIQGHVDYWKLEETASRPPNPSDPDDVGLTYGWSRQKCSVCGSPEVASWDQGKGYRCQDHR